MFNSEGRWVTAELFRAGDLVVFPMRTLHGSVRSSTRGSNSTCQPGLFCVRWCNLTLSSGGRAQVTNTEHRLRLSADIRFQPARDPVDDRYQAHTEGALITLKLSIQAGTSTCVM